MSLHDGLTGLANRRYFDKYLEEQVAIAHRHGRMLAQTLRRVTGVKSSP